MTAVRGLLLGTFVLVFAGCDDLPGGGGGGGGSDPDDTRPLLCRIERGKECSDCLETCCSPCADPASECHAYASCATACPDPDCVTGCEERFWDGLLELIAADDCVIDDCSSACGL